LHLLAWEGAEDFEDMTQPSPLLVLAPAAARSDVPTPLSTAVFRAKVTVLQMQRALRNLRARVRACPKSDGAGFSVTIAQSRTKLWSDERHAERVYQLGKVQNLRRACAKLDRIVISPDKVFSFWAQIGRASKRRGFVTGRMLQQGCLVPSTGGGLCQLSNALYDVAAQAGCEIVERHAHSRVVPGSVAQQGRDATVAWNYVDLRFRSEIALYLEARVERDELVLRLKRGPLTREATATVRPSPANDIPALRVRTVLRESAPAHAQSCGTCSETSCFRHECADDCARPSGGRTAFLVDENWGEFKDYVMRARTEHDVLGMPLDGARYRLARYRWPTGGFDRVGSAPIATLTRALAIRGKAQGPARRNAEIEGAQRIALRLSRLLGAEVERVVIAQSLLPFVWRNGDLGGRDVTVLMTRLPMTALQARLDAAFAQHPERTTLGDFRAPEWLVKAEREALAYASRIVTPHAEIAAMYPGKAELLSWHLPKIGRVERAATPPKRIAFPGPTIARKGAYELREAARTLGLEVVLLGSDLEGAAFWDGVATQRMSDDWLSGVAAVVQPAVTEERPRHLLAALAAGVPVIATAACGLGTRDGVTTIAAGDLGALIAALRTALSVR
jgi:hypothetical protein